MSDDPRATSSEMTIFVAGDPGQTIGGYFDWLDSCITEDDLIRERERWVKWSKQFKESDVRTIAMWAAYRARKYELRTRGRLDGEP